MGPKNKTGYIEQDIPETEQEEAAEIIEAFNEADEFLYFNNNDLWDFNFDTVE
jgi:hypothetical protein